jgi:hypothetical protein
VSGTWNTFVFTGPYTKLTPPTTILEELLERWTFFDLRARNAAVFRISEPEITVQAFLCFLLALDRHIELHKRLLNTLIPNRMYVPQRLTVQLKLYPLVSGLVVSCHLQFDMTHPGVFTTPSKTRYSCTGHSVPRR